MNGKTLIFGAGWLGTQFGARISNSVLTDVDIADEAAVKAALAQHDPLRVLNCAGRTGRPNVDSLESEPGRTYRSNVVGAIVVAAACRTRGIHFTHLGSGCIYAGDNGGAGFAEEDPANFEGSLYARTKALAESALRDLSALQLRIRLPLSAQPAPRNLLTKLLAYTSIVRVPNSITVLEDFWLPACTLIHRGETGIWNLVNDGVEYHDDLLALYHSLYESEVAAEHDYEVIAPEALESLVLAGRSNCVLSTEKLRAAGLAMPHLDETLPRLVAAYGRNLATHSGQDGMGR